MVRPKTVYSSLTLTRSWDWPDRSIIVLGGIKGGAGKSTIAANLAVRVLGRAECFLLIDGDEQETTTLWSATDTVPADARADRNFVEGRVREVLKPAPNYSDVVIDVGGRDTDT